MAQTLLFDWVGKVIGIPPSASHDPQAVGGDRESSGESVLQGADVSRLLS